MRSHLDPIVPHVQGESIKPVMKEHMKNVISNAKEIDREANKNPEQVLVKKKASCNLLLVKRRREKLHRW